MVSELEVPGALGSHRLQTHIHVAFFFSFLKSNLASNISLLDKNKIKTTGTGLVETYEMPPSPEDNISYPKVSKRSSPELEKQ